MNIDELFAEAEALPIAQRAEALRTVMACLRSYVRDGDGAVLRAIPEAEVLPAEEAKIVLQQLWFAASSGSRAEYAVDAARRRLGEREEVRP